MAGESFVNVTEGSGKKLHTYQRVVGANTVEDEFTIPGEPALASYVATFATAITLNNAAATQLIQLMAGAALKVLVRRITIYQAGLPAAGVNFILDIFRVTTAPTGGTAVTPSPMDTADAASGATSAYLPGVAGALGVRVGVATMQLSATAGLGGKAEWTFPPIGPKSLVIPAGVTNGIVIRNASGANTGSVVAEIVFSEASYS